MVNGKAYGTNTGTTNWSSYSCGHDGPVEVMKIGEATIWAGSWREMDHNFNFDLRIRLNDAFSLRDADTLFRFDTRANKMLGEDLVTLDYPPTLSIEWSDFGTPPIEQKWWVDLVAKIKTLGPIHIGIYCMGGHGRTGTALSILAHFSEQDIGKCKDTVDWVRTVYCDEAVESWAQIEYIQDITGEALTSYPTSYINAQAKKGYTYPKGTMMWDGEQGKYEFTDASPPVTQENSLFTNGAKAVVKQLSKGKRRRHK